MIKTRGAVEYRALIIYAIVAHEGVSAGITQTTVSGMRPKVSIRPRNSDKSPSLKLGALRRFLGKSLHLGKVLSGFVLGSRRLFQYIHDNPAFERHPTEYVNDPFVIAKHDRMVSINAAIEVDLTGQVCADSIGTHFYSGVGGQLDFVRGVARSEGGITH